MIISMIFGLISLYLKFYLLTTSSVKLNSCLIFKNPLFRSSGPSWLRIDIRSFLQTIRPWAMQVHRKNKWNSKCVYIVHFLLFYKLKYIASWHRPLYIYNNRSAKTCLYNIMQVLKVLGIILFRWNFEFSLSNVEFLVLVKTASFKRFQSTVTV